MRDKWRNINEKWTLDGTIGSTKEREEGEEND